jgi:hypothetical protein
MVCTVVSVSIVTAANFTLAVCHTRWRIVCCIERPCCASRESARVAFKGWTDSEGFVVFIAKHTGYGVLHRRRFRMDKTAIWTSEAASMATKRRTANAFSIFHRGRSSTRLDQVSSLRRKISE